MRLPDRIAIPAVSALVAACAPVVVAAQTVVPVHEEPRHRLVHDAPDLRVLDILIEPGDTTLFHRHDEPIAYVQIETSVINQQTLGGPWGSLRPGASPPDLVPGRTSWTESYRDDPVSHRVTALGPGPFRLIGVLNLGDGGAAPEPSPLGPFPEPDREGRFFRQARREVSPGDRLGWAPHHRAVVMILASGGWLAVEGEGAGARSVDMSGPGDFFVLLPGASYRIFNQGRETAAVTFVEVR